jgi:signal transduction histidine kinase/CheY-like chemotaxis protein
MKLTLFRRLFLVIVLAEFVTTVALGWTFYLTARRMVTAQLEERGRLLTLGLAAQSARALETENVFHTLEPLVQRAAREPDVAGVEVVDAKGVVVASAGGPIQGGGNLSFVEAVHPADTNAGRDPWVFDAPQSMARALGEVHVALSLSDLRHNMRRTALITLLVALLANLLAMVPTFAISRWIATRVVAAAEAAHWVADGDYNVRLDPKASGEIGTLARGFNTMVETLASTRATNQALLKKTQGQLEQSDKLAAVGQLAGGVAHDFNNLLSVIMSCGQFLHGDLADGDARKDDANEIVLAAKRAASLTRQLLAFSRRQVLQPKIVDVNKVVGDMEKMLQRLIGEDIELSFHPSASQATSCVDPGQLEQVLLNLVVNARDAMPAGGTIRVEVAPVSNIGQTTPAVAAGARYIAISVIDGGTGMTDETRARIFEPFFTTKGVGQGTGLGLATVFGIVKQSGGEIEVSSQVGKGSTFRVYLPAVDAAPAEAPAEAKVTTGHSAGTILLVEDDPQVRAIATRILRFGGYEVMDIGSPTAALDLATRFRERIALVISDVIMPEMNGPEMARRMESIIPLVKVLFMSGYTDRPTLDRLSADPDRFLQKPFNRDDLLSKVANLLRVQALPKAS